MTEKERQNHLELSGAISPFLVDCGFCSDEEAADELCKKIAVAFGGSGYTKKGASTIDMDEVPVLLNSPVRMIDNSGLQQVKATYGGAIISDTDFSDVSSTTTALHNAVLDIKQVAVTQKQIRRQRKESEALQRMLRIEAAMEAERRAEMAAARMAAIKASRTAGRQAMTGVSIENFSIPHPSGTGDLLSDATLVMSPGRRYGLIGRNGAGKSTLMRILANYKLPGLQHLRILLVDQHVEGDEDSPLAWLLRADIERTQLLADEARLSAFLHGSTDEPLPEDLKGVNLELALSECFERMDTIGVSGAENRAKKILKGLGFSSEMIEKPTISLSGIVLFLALI